LFGIVTEDMSIDRPIILLLQLNLMDKIVENRKAKKQKCESYQLNKQVLF
jgi:hypothetical protein